ncbi:retinal guanylate cyclase [Culex quinquefasciatus]|uniref:Retinal guanylate cyclase n=1 Tax=Culex quinquefasciatus TaxID=7176 RepID=B0X8S1_CULQU|nr:retinal guanylate cyclase [Culex quinquefasciatus]|eukprot:XP_001866043.1 retinal guanylate cyclase [Culex quinquefasciatus]
MSPQTCNLLEQAGGYVIEPRGPIEIKGKGKMHTYWLLGKKGFDKVLPTPPPIGLDIAILRKSLFQSEQNNQQQLQQYQQPIVSVDSHNGGSTTANHSSSHSPSVAGESIDVKVEITPPVASDNPPLMASISIDSGSSNANYTLNMGDFGAKTPLPSPQARKLSEIVSDTTFLSANSSFNRLNPSPPGSSSTRLFKRIEEMIDLSSPYNYYKCLSPSESNLSQCHIDGRFHGYQVNRMDCSSKPGSTRFLRRQFSLDKDDVGPSMSNSQKATLDTISSISIDRDQLARMGTLSSIPSISSANSVSMSASKQQRTIGIHKQQSASVAQDLEKIEEIPLSPQSQFLVNHNTTNSNSTSSLQSEVNEKARSAQNGKELCLSIEALGLR